jgi:signal transduction histidine kinase
VEQLIFTDNGMGFDLEKVKDRIFGFQQKFHGHTDSKGIGLYLVYNHITSLGGQISIQSKVNEGSRFVISFKV